MKKTYLTHSISQELLINNFLKSSNINDISTDFASKKLSEILNSKNNILNKFKINIKINKFNGKFIIKKSFNL